jgi:hypothetical protein
MAERNPDNVNFSPVETEDLRANLAKFLNTPFGVGSKMMPIGNYRWGVYAFFVYDRELIYLGQTNEMVRTRIRRHLTNQRTDAVAMSVLDPLEVFEIAVWPLPQFQKTKRTNAAARVHLDALKRKITNKAVRGSKFKAILNEKDRPVTWRSRSRSPSVRALSRTASSSSARIPTSVSPVAR